LVGDGDQARRHVEAERAYGLHVDDELELCWLQHRHVCGLLAFENAADVSAELAICIQNICAIAHQPADFSILAIGINRRHSMTPWWRGELHATSTEQIVGHDRECVDSVLRNAGESCVNLALGASAENFELYPNGRRRRLCVFNPGLSEKRIVRVDK